MVWQTVIVPWQNRYSKNTGNDHKACSNWFFGDDAWIFGVRCERRLLGSIPYLAQYNDRRGGRAVDETVCV